VLLARGTDDLCHVVEAVSSVKEADEREETDEEEEDAAVTVDEGDEIEGW
jgi:hypothetical protein